MTITLEGKLNDLFESWKQAHEGEADWKTTTVCQDVGIYAGIEQDSFVKDGIVSDNYDHKMLFVLKEANIRGYRKNEICKPEDRTQIEWYKNFVNTGEDNRTGQLKKIGRMYCALINNNKSPSDLEIRNGIDRISFMNLNKRGGSSICNGDLLYAYVNKYKWFILKQIQILNPEYIICLGTYRWISSINPDIEKQYKVKNIWHPSYPKEMNTYMNEFFERCNI